MIARIRHIFAPPPPAPPPPVTLHRRMFGPQRAEALDAYRAAFAIVRAARPLDQEAR